MRSQPCEVDSFFLNFLSSAAGSEARLKHIQLLLRPLLLFFGFGATDLGSEAGVAAR